MRVLIRRFEMQGGQPVPVERRLDSARLRLGRGANQDVELPDLHVALAHAEITPGRGGRHLVEALSGTAVRVNGVPVARRELSAGDWLDLGRYRLRLLPPPAGTDLLLSVEERLSEREEKAHRQQQFRSTLEQAGLSKRAWAWGLFLLVLFTGLAAPAALRYLPPVPVGHLDHVWELGEASPAHAHFIARCDRCHEQPFHQVRNEACGACHAGVHRHTASAALLAQPEFAGLRCRDCHAEHEGKRGLVSHGTGQCLACHAQPQRFTGVGLEPVRSFGGEHPAFAPRLLRYDAARGYHQTTQRQGTAAALSEQNNLIYPHDLHLSPRGIESPDGRKRLHCGDCHVPSAGGAGFLPVRMEQHCAGCHRLDFDPADPDRQLPHGQPAQIVQILRDYYGRQALAGGVRVADAPTVVQQRRRPGEILTRPQSEAALRWATQRADQVVTEVFERRVCNTCHVVQRSGDAALPWRVLPARLSGSYLPGAAFDHAAHAGEKCDSCHAAAQSAKSSDVLLPEIGRCRDCHGDAGGTSKVASTCVDCHGFHTAAGTRMTAGREGGS